MLLIGFGSRARNGKDTAASAIKAHYERENTLKRRHGVLRGLGTRVGIFKYATALYEEVNKWLEKNPTWPEQKYSFYTINDAEDGYLYEVPSWVQPTPNAEVIPGLAPYGKHAKLLQWWGTEYRRNNFGEDYWVKKLFASIPANLNIALITDVRFPNEATAVEERGGYTVNVQRLRVDGTPFYDPSRPADHPSETALDGWNWNFKIVSPESHAAWTEQQAINLAEYLRALRG